MDGIGEVSRRLVDTSLLPPNLERLGTSASIAGCRQEMAPQSEMSVDYRVRRDELLCLTARFELLHLPLSSSGGSMRVFGAIVQIPACAMPDIGQVCSLSDAVAAQPIRDEAPWLVLQTT
jgi:hypothetical protein